MPLFEECTKACSEVFSTVKRGADNVKRPDLSEEQQQQLKTDITEMRKNSGILAKETLKSGFADNIQVSLVYSYAHYVKKYGAARCMGQACLAASLLLQKKIHCAIGIVKMDSDDQHVFVIAQPDPVLAKTGSEIATLSPALIVDSWIVMKCEGEGLPRLSGVFSPQEFSKLMAHFNYGTALSFASYIESPFV